MKRMDELHQDDAFLKLSELDIQIFRLSRKLKTLPIFSDEYNTLKEEKEKLQKERNDIESSLINAILENEDLIHCDNVELEALYKELTTHTRSFVLQKLKEARQKGDLSDNPEYDIARSYRLVLEKTIDKVRRYINYDNAKRYNNNLLS